MTITATEPRPRNGVDTADPVRHPRRGQGSAGRRPSSSSAPTTSGSAAPTTAAPSTASSASARSAPTSARFAFDADHPAVLVGQDNGPTPVEFVLHALAACLTAGLANIAAARGITLTEVTLHGRPATSTSTASSASTPRCATATRSITVRFTVKGDAPAEQLREIVEQSRPARRSTTSSPTRCPSPSRST